MFSSRADAPLIKKAFSYVSEQVAKVSDPILKDNDVNSDRIEDLIWQVAISANIFKTLTEQITELLTETKTEK